MSFEAGNVIEGRVTGVMNFGAFVQLPEGKSGLVHISEVADEFVRDINEHLKENQIVKVKIISLDKGKIGLSIKQASGLEPIENKVFEKKAFDGKTVEKRSSDGRSFARPARPVNFDKSKKLGPDATFDDKLAKFMKDSEEKIHDLKKGFESKRGSGGYRKSAQF